MQKTAEAVSLGHPDKIADYISCIILDKCIEQDSNVKYAVEVMIKDNTVVLGGEITGNVNLSNLKQYVIEALNQIGYTEEYSKVWGNYTISPQKIKLITLIGKQSVDINAGVVKQKGWGDQGVFVGYACKGEENINRELFLARKLNTFLYNYAKAHIEFGLGLDIKTQITLNDFNNIETVIVAIPMLENIDLTDIIKQCLNEPINNIIVNGAGRYTFHSSIADCGITGRKLACDFYSTASPIGGGSPWTKDSSKADLTLNLFARKLAKDYLLDNDECFVYLSSCIGRSDLPSTTVKTIKNNVTYEKNIVVQKSPSEIKKILHLDQPIFGNLCKKSVGLKV